jgi:peptidyl-tRNA hydrolase, PTH1 family
VRLVVGLGNPGERYRRTRHNVGFMVVDELASRGGRALGREECEAWLAPAEVAGQALLLVKPLTFMNRSGVSVEKILRLTGGGPQDLLVVVDDVALELGWLRVRERGSHGGHNGLRSIIEVLGTEDFARVRVGIRRGDVGPDLAGYVLAPFPSEHVLVVQELVGKAADAVESWIGEGPATAMNRFNSGPKV